MLFEALFLTFVLGSEALQRNAAARQVEAWDRELTKMEIWDGVEYQIREHCKFYDRRILPRKKYFVRFGGDKSKYRDIAITDVQANRDYWRSGLSAKDYAIQYFKDRFLEDPKWENAHDIYRADFTSIKELNLFDREGNETHFSLDYCYSSQCDNAEQHRYLSWWGTTCETGNVIFPI